MSPDKKILKFFLLLILLFASVRLASAQTNFTLPTILPSTPAASGPDPVGFVSNLYQFGLMIGGLLAFGMIVYAGLRHTLAAGNPSSQSDARDQILQALLGLLLLFGAFIVLNTINPNLTNLSLPKLGGVEGPAAPTQETPALNTDQVTTELGSMNVHIPADATIEAARQRTLDAISDLKQQCATCNITVNSITERNLELQGNTRLNEAISQFTDLSSGGDIVYKSVQSGAIYTYVKGKNLWEVQVKPKK